CQPYRRRGIARCAPRKCREELPPQMGELPPLTTPTALSVGNLSESVHPGDAESNRPSEGRTRVREPNVRVRGFHAENSVLLCTVLLSTAALSTAARVSTG